jgi:hypothetical protein
MTDWGTVRRLGSLLSQSPEQPEIEAVRQELAQSREEVMRLRDLPIGAGAELGRVRGRRAKTAILVAIAALAVTGFVSAHTAIAGVCETKVVRNYLKPVEALPALRGIPASHELSFGPAGLLLSDRGQSPIMPPGRREVIYTIHRPADAPNGRLSTHLNWLVTAKLARAGRRRPVSRVLDRSQRRVASVGPGRSASLRLRLPGAVGIYRLEIAFRNGAGTLLGRFGSYVRVVRPPPEGRHLTLDRTSFLPGETVVAHAEELGIDWIEMGDVYSIEVYDGSAWTVAPISPRTVSLLIGTVLGPGEATSVRRFMPGTPCWSFTIPAGAPPGSYRFVIDGRSLKAVDDRLWPGSPLTLSSEFQIVAG